MKETQTYFKKVLEDMLMDIVKSWGREEDPLTRCELAKGFLEIGDYLSKN